MIQPLLMQLFFFLCSTVASGEETPNSWPDYRGPHANGYAGNPGIPLTWGEGQNVSWKTPIHDRGWSSPIVANGRIWMTTALASGKKLFVVCVDLATGKILHDVELFKVAKPQENNPLNSYASPSPVVDDKYVYVHFGTYGTACLDQKTAKVKWERRDIVCDHIVGPGSSPFLYQDLLIFHMDGGDVQYVLALDTSSGETTWKVERTVEFGTLAPDLRKAYNTPLLIEVDGKPQLFSIGAQRAYSYDPDTGDEIWAVNFSGFSMASRPVFGNGMVYFGTGFMKPSLLAVRVDGSEDVTDTHIAWKLPRNVPTMASPLLLEDLLYLVDDGGIASCTDANTGENIWRERLEGEYSASPLFADERIYFFNQDGLTTVIEPGRTFKVLGKSQLESGFMASPAVVGKTLLLRTEKHLYRIEEGAKVKSTAGGSGKK